ncbi:MAG: nitroreductase family protein, partial [Acidimicrobiales bacterium]|nr:nitroreductase family protein [Acidimicrobiales bacterium]
MDFAEAAFYDVLRRRRMVRNYTADPIDPDVLDRVVAAGLRGPSAGNTQGADLLVLTGDAVARYWSTTLPSQRRAEFPWPGLLRAPVL